MKMIEFVHGGKYLEGCFTKHEYQGGKLAIQLHAWSKEFDRWEPYARLSVNTDDAMEPGCFAAKTYSENHGLVEQFVGAGVFERTGNVVSAGHVTCPVLRVTEMLGEYLME